MKRAREFFTLFAVLCLAITGCDADADTPETVDDADPVDLAALSTSECYSFGTSLAGVVARGIGSDFEERMGEFRSFAQATPPEVRDDFEVVIDAYDESFQMMEEGGVDFSDASTLQSDAGRETMAAADAVLEDPTVQEAYDTVEEFIYEVCPVLR